MRWKTPGLRKHAAALAVVWKFNRPPRHGLLRLGALLWSVEERA